MEFDYIYKYTREMALADGVLCDLTQFEITRKYYKYPVACTETVWNVIEAALNNKEECFDLTGILHDIYSMSIIRYKEVDPTTRTFEVYINHELYQLKSVCGPGDNLEPVITIMMIDED